MTTNEKMPFAYMNDVLYDRWWSQNDNYGDGPSYRFCGQCGEMMTEGYVDGDEGDTLCSDTCMGAAEWMVHDPYTSEESPVLVTPALINGWFNQPDGGDRACIYWTDWA